MFNLIKRLSPTSMNTVIHAVIIFLVFPIIVSADEFKVSLIPSSDSIIYTRTIDGIKSALSNNKYNPIIIEVVPLTDFNNPEFSLPNDTDLLVPIGQLALKEVTNKHINLPVISTLITRLDFLETLGINGNDNLEKVGAIFIDQPLKRILLFSRLALPNNKRLGFLMSNKYRTTLTEFNSVIKDYSYHLEIHDNKTNLITSLNRVMDDADVILATPDKDIFNRRNTHNILLSTYRKLIPVIGFSKSYIRAGALTGIYSTPELIGKQTGELINSLSISNNSGNLPRLNALYYQVGVNNKVARSLGLPMLDEDQLKQKLLELESGQE